MNASAAMMIKPNPKLQMGWKSLRETGIWSEVVKQASIDYIDEPVERVSEGLGEEQMGWV